VHEVLTLSSRGAARLATACGVKRKQEPHQESVPELVVRRGELGLNLQAALGKTVREITEWETFIRLRVGGDKSEKLPLPSTANGEPLCGVLARVGPKRSPKRGSRAAEEEDEEGRADVEAQAARLLESKQKRRRRGSRSSLLDAVQGSLRHHPH